jgi:hypothetical protein
MDLNKLFLLWIKKNMAFYVYGMLEDRPIWVSVFSISSNGIFKKKKKKKKKMEEVRKR